MLRSRGILAVIVTGLVMGSLACGSASAADAKTAAQVFATVDVEQTFNGYAKKTQLESELMGLYDQAKQRLELRNANKLLSAEEFAQLADAKLKAKPTDADVKKVDEMSKLSVQREQEFQSLQQKQGASDADKLRLSQLQDQINKTGQTLKEDEGKYEADLNKRRVDLSTQLMNEVNTAVQAVAKEKGITMVFNKSLGEPGFVIYSNFDITEEVLKKLNKK